MEISPEQYPEIIAHLIKKIGQKDILLEKKDSNKSLLRDRDREIVYLKKLNSNKCLLKDKEIERLNEIIKNIEIDRPFTSKILTLIKENTKLRETLSHKSREKRKEVWLNAKNQHKKGDNYYVYIWCNDKGVPFYIGKGTGDRAYQITDRSHKFRRIYDTQRNPEVTLVCKNISESLAFHIEEMLIKLFKDSFDLSNIIYNNSSLDNKVEILD